MNRKFLNFFISFQLFITAFASQISFANDNPLIDLELSQGQVIDILNVCFSQTLDCRLLVREMKGKLEHILLIGESHDQSKQSYNLGAKILKHYTLIGQETGSLSRFFDYCPTFLARYVKKSFLGFYSLCMFPGEKQETFNLEKGYRTKTCQTDSISNVCDFILMAGGMLLSFSSLNLIDQLFGSLCTTFGISDYFQRRENAFDIDILYKEVPERDRLMARFLLEKLSSSSSSSIVGVMGTGHLYGVTKALKKSGFSNRDQDLMTQYRTFMANKEISKFLVGTKERDYTNLKTCSVLFDCEDNAKKSYPEDF